MDNTNAEFMNNGAMVGQVPMAPSTPKPSNLPSGNRYKYAITSVGSLATAVETRDIMEDFHQDDEDFEAVSISSESDSEEDGVMKVKTAGDLPTVAEQTEEDDDTAASEASTGHFTISEGSERDPDELDDFLDEELMRRAQGPLLKLDEGLRPRSDMQRCPPITWLRAAGFEMPDGRGFDLVPVAPVCGERPTRYLDLFSRQMLAREGPRGLTMETLSRHTAMTGRSRHSDPLPKPAQEPTPAPEPSPAEFLSQNGAWLEAFIAKARSMPLHRAAEELVGADLGLNVSAFLDSLSDTSGAEASIADDDVPDGFNVTGQKFRQRPCHRGRGRAGFMVELEGAISTPGRSQSPPPRRELAPLPMDTPQPPLIRAP